MNNVPCFIINRDRLYSTKAMVEYLTPDTGCYPVVLDNGSTYFPLLEWYATNPCTVELLGANFGNQVLWSAPTAIENHPKPEFFERYGIYDGQDYIVSDSDLDLSNVKKDFLEVMRETIRLYPDTLTVGLGLEINDLPDTDIAKEAKGWEWGNMAAHAALDPFRFKSQVDTTFAYYHSPRKDARDFDRCIRLNYPYVCRHLSWYVLPDGSNLTDDERYYLSRIDRNFNHYSIRIKNQLEGRNYNDFGQ